MEKKDSASFLTLVVLACFIVVVSTLGVSAEDHQNPLKDLGDEVVVLENEEELGVGVVKAKFMALTEVELPDDEVEESTYDEELIEDAKEAASATITPKKVVKALLDEEFLKSLVGIKTSNGNLQQIAVSGDVTVGAELIASIEAQNIIVEELVSGEETISIEEVVEDQESVLDGPPTSYQKVMNMQATAYCLCKKCCGKSPSSPGYGRTASGLVIVPGTGMKVIAVDKKVIPLGTKVYVQSLDGSPDYGYAIAADTGGAIKNNKIDLYKETHADALKWGRRNVKLYILDEQ